MSWRGLSVTALFCAFAATFLITAEAAGDFNKELDVLFGDGRAKILENGQLMTLSMDTYMGSGFKSKKEYLFGRFDMRIKLIAGDSAGTVTTFYLTSLGDFHDEIDFEFLGNLTGSPYTVHTNVIVHGTGGREQEFYLWFDPTQDFHLYSIVWNPQHIIWLVDNIPIRVYNNIKSPDSRYPTTQAMRMYTTLWNGDGWATQGGRVKVDWSKAPFVASYRDYAARACLWPYKKFPCPSKGAPGNSWQYQNLTAQDQNKLRWVQNKFMIYNYCADHKRYASGLPSECRS